jgi:hypothetical protein
MLLGFLPRCGRRKPGGFSAEEALPAVDRAALRRFEWDRGFTAALRARGHGFGFGKTSATTPLALGLTCLAALGFVFEVFVVEEVLFSRSEYEICVAVYTL